MNHNRLLVSTIALFLGTTGMYTARASGQYQGTPPSSYGRDRGAWDAPPQGMQEIQRQGFRDGLIGAQKDYDNHRQWDVNNRDEYRNPNIPRNQREAYRDGFRRGYQRGVSHLTGGSYGGGFYTGQGQGSEIQRRGYQDGMMGAQKDLDNHRQWNVNNRDEYRNPNVPAGAQQEYRDAFSSGYQQFVSQQSGGGFYTAPGQGSEIQRRGYQDGMIGAQKDLDNHRQWNVNNRDEYRNPNVPAGAQQEYRDAFSSGYQQFVSQQSGGGFYTAPGQGSEIQRRGYQDGMIGAQKDLDNHRQWNVNNRDEYRNPNVPAGAQQEYRDAFSSGYQQFVSQQSGGGFYTGQGQGSEIQRRGYQDGMMGAQKDLDNHRQWNVNNRDEYRNPNVPAGAQQEYRDAFSSGYQQFVSQQSGGGFYTGQGQGSEIQRRGYQDGMMGAQKDLDNHRQWNVNNRDEYRNPNVPAGAQQEYRDAFSSGYQQFVSQHSEGQPYRP